MSSSALLADPRRRNLAVLGGIALVSLLLAIAALWERQAQTPPAPTPFLDGFAAEEPEAARIHVESKSGAFDVVLGPEHGWGVAQRHNYPASLDLVKRTKIGLGALETIAPKTARPDWLHYLDLDAPPQGDGILLTVSDDKGRVLASVITGKSEDIGDAAGAVGMFVRRPGETQSWLVRSVLDPRAALADWLDKHVLEVDVSRLQEVDVDPLTGPSYAVARAKPSDADYALLSPAGLKLGDPAAADGVATAVADFVFDDVRLAQEVDFGTPATASRLVAKTFNGLWITVRVAKLGAEYWASVSAEAAPGTSAAVRQAAQINMRNHRWAYKLPAYKGQLFMTTLEILTKAPAAPPPTPGQP